jgi:hypothetical protein
MSKVIRVSGSFDEETVRLIKRECKKEKRSFSGMLEVLVCEALRIRKDVAVFNEPQNSKASNFKIHKPSNTNV